MIGPLTDLEKQTTFAFLLTVFPKMKKLYVNLCPMLSIDGAGDDGYEQDVGIHRGEDGQASQVAGRQRQGQVGSPSQCLPHRF
jgi:hypothetical protein